MNGGHVLRALRRIHHWVLKGFVLVLALVVKLGTEWLLVRREPSATLSTLVGWRYVPFFLEAVTRAGIIGIRWWDTGRAWEMLPAQTFLFRIRIADLIRADKRGVVLMEPEYGRPFQGRRTVRMEGTYYKSILAADPSVHVLPYFCHPSIYTTGLHAFARSLAILERERSVLLIFSRQQQRLLQPASGKLLTTEP